jgi:tetratricopeptide (TPR) repeat protein
LNQQEVDASLADFSKAIELEPDNPEVYFNRGQTYLLATNFLNDPSFFALCIADFNQAIALDPTNPESFNQRATCKLLSGDYEGAYNDFSEAIRLDPQEARFYLYRATLYPDFGQLDAALADAQKVLDLTQGLEATTEITELRTSAEQLLKELPTLATTPTAQP